MAEVDSSANKGQSMKFGNIKRLMSFKQMGVSTRMGFQVKKNFGVQEDAANLQQ